MAETMTTNIERTQQAANSIHHLFEIAAPMATVFSALTTIEGLSSWWTTGAQTTGAVVGATIDAPFHTRFRPRLRITEIALGSRVIWEGVSGHDIWGETLIRFDLEVRGDGTLVRFWHSMGRDRSDDAVGSANFRWGYYLESLRLFCETGVGHPDSPSAA